MPVWLTILTVLARSRNYGKVQLYLNSCPATSQSFSAARGWASLSPRCRNHIPGITCSVSLLPVQKWRLWLTGQPITKFKWRGTNYRPCTSPNCSFGTTQSNYIEGIHVHTSSSWVSVAICHRDEIIQRNLTAFEKLPATIFPGQISINHRFSPTMASASLTGRCYPERKSRKWCKKVVSLNEALGTVWPVATWNASRAPSHSFVDLKKNSS